MKLKEKHLLKFILSIFFLFLVCSWDLHAQLPSFMDDVDDSSPAPINGLIGIGLAIGAYLGVQKLKENSK